jgi:uncharacterized protein
MGQISTETDVDDFLRGANFLSASGGGDPVVEREHLHADVSVGRDVGWRSLDRFADDDLLVCCCYSGSIAPETFDDPSVAARALGGAHVHERPFTEAVGLLESHLGIRAAGLISVELGGINAGAVLAASAASGLPLADADYSGRAIPELHSSGLALANAPVLPFACIDHFDNRVLIVGGPSDAWTERVTKHLALASLGLIGCAFAALPARAVRDIAVTGTMTECHALGRAIRVAREAGEDPVAAAAEQIGGWVLFQGRGAGREWANTGYMDGTHTLAGEGRWAGRRLAVWFRNENHVSWLDGEPWVASPDLIEFCDPSTGEPLVNTYLELGQEIAVVGRRRRDRFDSSAGIDTLGPRHFGFDVEFAGIETLV